MDLKLVDALLKSRYESGLSQRELAEQLGVSKKTVQN
jgi:DNA-binding XRE family transcriptional regulator